MIMKHFEYQMVKNMTKFYKQEEHRADIEEVYYYKKLEYLMTIEKLRYAQTDTNEKVDLWEKKLITVDKDN